MSKHHNRDFSHSVLSVQKNKKNGQKISMVTCYDAAFARLIDDTNIEIVLVGDSLGNVIMGYEDTTKVTLQDVIHHCAAVGRVLRRPLLCADMPFLTYQVSCAETLRHGGLIMQQGGAQCVKLEGGRPVAKQVKILAEAGIPVMGHLGLTPQSIHMLGGYRVQGRSEMQRQQIIDDAKALEEAGAFALVLELVPHELAKEITEILSIPTIGIGAGSFCDGQVLVLHDLLGFDSEFQPKFLKKYANLSSVIKNALNEYDSDIKNGVFPSPDHSFS